MPRDLDRADLGESRQLAQCRCGTQGTQWGAERAQSSGIRVNDGLFGSNPW
jgi:hypothetical protein